MNELQQMDELFDRLFPLFNNDIVDQYLDGNLPRVEPPPMNIFVQ